MNKTEKKIERLEKELAELKKELNSKKNRSSKFESEHAKRKLGVYRQSTNSDDLENSPEPFSRSCWK